MNASRASAREASDRRTMERFAGVICLAAFALKAWSAPHDYLVLQRELATVPLARVFGVRATGEFAQSVDHVGSMAAALIWISIAFVPRRASGLVSALALVVMIVSCCLTWSNQPWVWCLIALLVLGVLYAVSIARRRQPATLETEVS